MKKIEKIFEYLRSLYPDPKTELNYDTPFQLMMAVIMSAQTTDKQVNKVTETLFKIIKSPQDVLDMWIKKFTTAIKSVNYYKTKAKNLMKLAEILKKSALPSDVVTPPTPSKIEGALNTLVKLPGIGIKSAKVIWHVLWDLPVIAVDTHVHRVVNRLWLVTTKSPEETSKLLEKIVPKKYKDFAHHAIVLFGRYVCTAKKPKCPECGLKTICQYFINL